MSRRKLRRDKDVILRDLVTALAVCHNVTPIVNMEKIGEDGEIGEKEY